MLMCFTKILYKDVEVLCHGLAWPELYCTMSISTTGCFFTTSALIFNISARTETSSWMTKNRALYFQEIYKQKYIYDSVYCFLSFDFKTCMLIKSEVLLYANIFLLNVRNICHHTCNLALLHKCFGKHCHFIYPCFRFLIHILFNSKEALYCFYLTDCCLR